MLPVDPVGRIHLDKLQQTLRDNGGGVFAGHRERSLAVQLELILLDVELARWKRCVCGGKLGGNESLAAPF